jgi:hypothetical protein
MYLMVDDEDAHWLDRHRWHINKKHTTCYAQTRVYANGGRSKMMRLHRVIMNAPDGLDVDHINGNGLDNRRCNLRLATRSQNAANAKRHRDNASSRYKGLLYTSRLRKPWQAVVCVKGVHYRSLRFAKEIDAARAYDELARRFNGEFARCNFKSAGA